MAMPIPDLTAAGFLPEGVHDCTLAEIRERFGQFQRTDNRPRLFARLEQFVRDARTSGLVIAIIVDGSFATSKDDPNDVDVIVVLRRDHDFGAVLRPMEYNVVVQPQIRRLYRLDALVAETGTVALAEHVALFRKLRGQPDVVKGMLRIVP
jgi:hypothetical protein